jgi:tetratricopeptide (TPR) repeat protein
MLDFQLILLHLGRAIPGGGSLPSHSPDLAGHQPLTLKGQVVVFTGKLSSLGRKDARALVARLGGATSEEVNARTTMLVIGAEGGSENAGPEKSVKLKRAEELNAERREPQIRIVSEEEFCSLTGVPTPSMLKQQYYALRDLPSRYRALREDHLRYLVKCGLIHPVLRTNSNVFLGFSDLAVVKQANAALDQGASFRGFVRSLLAARHGQLELDFRLDATPAKIFTLERRPGSASGPGGNAARLGQVSQLATAHSPLARPTPRQNAALAEDYFRAGSALDEIETDPSCDPDAEGEEREARLQQAASAYRKALELDPYLVAALINLANIHYSHDELIEAQALYERAIALEPDFFEAHFNLGNIYHDLGRFPEAQNCYGEALRLNPTYADAHFYLAVTFEKMGQSADARPHWRAYQQLAPQGEWVELAKEFSD